MLRFANRLESAIETPRLRLRPFQAGDVDAFYTLNRDVSVRKFIGGEALSKAYCEKHITRTRDFWATRGYSQCAIVRRSDERLIGRGGVNILEELDTLEVSWVIARTEWGHGYATEAGRAALTFAFNELKTESICAPIHPRNSASLRVAEKLGLRCAGLVDVYSDGTELMNFVMDRSAWATAETHLARDIRFFSGS